MSKFPTFNPLVIAYFSLLLSISLNLSALYVFRHRQIACEPKVVDDSQFSYVGGDHPHELPIYIPNIALAVENSERYGLADFEAWVDWRTLDAFPYSNGFVRLGPEGRSFGLAMFHQMHCLQQIRQAITQSEAGMHVRHCLNLIRQAVLCASDTTLDPLNSAHGTDGVGVVHVCRDWRKVYNFVEKNQLQHADLYNKTRAHDEH